MSEICFQFSDNHLKSSDIYKDLSLQPLNPKAEEVNDFTRISCNNKKHRLELQVSFTNFVMHLKSYQYLGMCGFKKSSIYFKNDYESYYFSLKSIWEKQMEPQESLVSSNASLWREY